MSNGDNSEQAEKHGIQFLAKVPTSYRISIPVEVRELLNLKPGDFIKVTVKVVRRGRK